MSCFVLLDELAATANSSELPYEMNVYFGRESKRDMKYAKDLTNAYEEFLDIVNQRKKYIDEMGLVCPTLRMFKCWSILRNFKSPTLSSFWN